MLCILCINLEVQIYLTVVYTSWKQGSLYLRIKCIRNWQTSWGEILFSLKEV